MNAKLVWAVRCWCLLAAGCGAPPPGGPAVRPFPATVVEVRMQNMCREAIARRSIRGAVDDAAAAAIGMRRGLGFEDTPWAQADAGYAVGDWQSEGPSFDHVVVGAGELRELELWEVRAPFGAASPVDPGVVFGRVWCSLIVERAAGDIWFRRMGSQGGEGAPYWLQRGDPEALTIVEYLEP